MFQVLKTGGVIYNLTSLNISKGNWTTYTSPQWKVWRVNSSRTLWQSVIPIKIYFTSDHSSWQHLG